MTERPAVEGAIAVNGLQDQWEWPADLQLDERGAGSKRAVMGEEKEGGPNLWTRMWWVSLSRRRVSSRQRDASSSAS